jgi:hypothetical protein
VRGCEISSPKSCLREASASDRFPVDCGVFGRYGIWGNTGYSRVGATPQSMSRRFVEFVLADSDGSDSLLSNRKLRL